MTRTGVLVVRRLCSAALLAVFCSCAFAQEQPGGQGAPTLTFMTEHRPPNNFLDLQSGEVVGANTLLLRQALARVGLQARFELAQWSRSYGMALTKPDTCVYSTVRTSRREPLFKWVGPIDETVFVLLARKEADIELAALEDARPYRIGVFSRDIREITLRHLGGFNIDVVPDDLLNARKLLEGRIDIWFTDLDALAELSAKAREEVKIVLRLPPAKLFLACNQQTPDEVVAALNRALRDINAERDNR